MKIGVFDSGIGGLTVLHEIRRLCPGHSTVYVGDTARVPYGSKSPKTVQRYCLSCAETLLREGIDYLVVACNTASAYGLECLAGLGVGLTGVIEPGSRVAAGVAASRIGVLGTSGTIRSGAYPRAIRALRPDVEIQTLACPLFVPLVEEGWEDTDVALLTARRYLAPWTAAAAGPPDTVILGCTHYPLLKGTLGAVLGAGARLIDSAEATAGVVREQLARAPDEPRPAHRIFLTDVSEGFVHFAERFFADQPDRPAIEHIDLEMAPAQPGS